MSANLTLKTGELPAVAVCKFLRKKGYILSNFSGHRINKIHPGMWTVGILENRVGWPEDLRYQKVADISFLSYNPQKRTGDWLFTALGTSRLYEWEGLVQEMAKLFKVKIKMRLSCSDYELVSMGCRKAAV